MKGFLTTTGKTRRFISWFLASLLVISSFMYGGVTKVHAEEIDGATQLDAGEQGDQADAPDTVEQVNEEALPEAEVPEIEEGVTAADTDPGVAEGLVYTGAAQRLLTSAAKLPSDAPSGAQLRYIVGTTITSSSTGINNITRTNAGTYTVAYGYRYTQSGQYRYATVGTVEVTIAPADIDTIPDKRVRIRSGLFSYQYSPFTYSGEVISPEFYLRNARNTNLVEGTDFRVESGVTSASAIGEYKITVLGLGNYEGTTTVTWEIQEDPYIVYPGNGWDIRVNDTEVEYDGEPHGLGVTLRDLAEGASIEYLLLEDGEEADWDSEEVTDECEFTDAGEYTVAWRVYTEETDMDGNPVHSPATGVGTVTINPKEVHVISNDISKEYDGKPFDAPELVVDQIGEDDGSFAPLDGDTINKEDIKLALSDEAAEATDVGSYEIVVENEDKIIEAYPNYKIVVTTGNAEITKKPLTITLKEGEYSKIYSQAAIDFSAELVYDGLVEGDEIIGEPVLSSNEGSTWNIYNEEDSNTLDAGTYYIHQYSTNIFGNITGGIRPQDNPNYEITFEGATYTVEKKDINEVEVFLDADGYYEYTGSKITIDPAVEDIVDDIDCIASSDYAISGEKSATNYGDYTINIEATSDGNYFGKQEAKWSIVAYVEETHIYDGEAHMLTESNIQKAITDGTITDIRYSIDEPTEKATVENYADLYAYASLDEFKEAYLNEKEEEFGKNVGEYTLYYVILLRNGNAVFASKANIIIEPKPLGITFEPITKIYDGSTDVKFDDIEEYPTGVEGEALKVSNIVGGLESPDSNYALKLSEDETRYVTFESKPTVEPANDVTLAENYKVVLSEDYLCTVSRKPLFEDDFAIDTEDKEYDGTVEAVSEVKCNTGVEGDELLFETESAVFTDGEGNPDANVAYDDEGKVMGKNVDIVAKALEEEGYADPKNYVYKTTEESEGYDPTEGIMYLGSAAIINPREITVTPNSATKIYDGKVATTDTIKPTYVVDGIDEDIAELDEFAKKVLEDPDSIFSAKLDDKVEAKNVGEYTLLIFTEDEAFEEKNFSININQSSFTITPKAVTVKVNDASKKVGEADPVFKYSVTGLADGDSLKNVKLTRVAGEAAGTYKVSATSDADKNYTITYVDGTFTIEASYSNEWVDGQWYDADGKADYAPKGSWKQNATGWWYEDESGWYPVNCWQKIDGVWYHFKFDGYMAASEWIEGYWLDADGAWTYEPKGSWKQDSSGWWYEDTAGWYPQNQWQKIDNVWYFFGADGYLVTSQYVGEYWVNADGAWAE